METTRARLGSVVEWLLAAVFIVAAVMTIAIAVRELRSTAASTRAIAREGPEPAVIPAGIPARAVSVPVLILPDKKEVRVGDSVSAIAARLGRNAEVGSQTVERGRFGERLTRFYEHAGTRFALVFEAVADRAEPRVAAIYLH
jgi:hypothetical protein